MHVIIVWHHVALFIVTLLGDISRRILSFSIMDLLRYSCDEWHIHMVTVYHQELV